MNLLLLFTLGTIWGTSFLFIKVIVGEVAPLTLVAGRLGIATIAMWTILRLRGVPFPRDRRLWKTYAVVGMLNGALPYTLISWGEQHISSGLAALLQATLPIITVILAHFLTKDDRLTPQKVAGTLLGFAGVGVLMLPELRAGFSASLLGQLAIVGASVSYAIASIYARKRLHGQSPFVSAAGQFTMGFLYILPLSLLVDRPFPIRPSGAALGSWIALSLLGTVIAYAIYYALLQRTSATFTTTVTYIIPVNGLLLGALILGEHINPNVLLSLALIFGGVLLVRIRTANHAH